MLRGVRHSIMTPSPRGRAAGFTLAELIVVMMVLATVLAISAPRLAGFSRGRTLQEETRRLLALTRFGRSEAVSRGEVMRLDLEPETGYYELAAAAPSGTTDLRTWSYTLDDTLSFEVDSEDSEAVYAILFNPDGSIDADSLESFDLVQDGRYRVRIEMDDAGLEYFAGEAGDD